MKVKRKAKVSSKDFLNIFTNRSLSLKHKILTNFTFIEDEDGNYYLTESTPLYIKLLFILLFPLGLICVFIDGGLISCVEVTKESYKAIKKTYSRIDTCRHGVESTDKLKEIVKWK